MCSPSKPKPAEVKQPAAPVAAPQETVKAAVDEAGQEQKKSKGKQSLKVPLRNTTGLNM